MGDCGKGFVCFVLFIPPFVVCAGGNRRTQVTAGDIQSVLEYSITVICSVMHPATDQSSFAPFQSEEERPVARISL